MILAGLPANLLALLALPGGKDWAAKKARVLTHCRRPIRGERRPIRSSRADVAGYRKLLAEWPGRIVMAGAELNEALPFPSETLNAIAAWAPNHPVVDAYRAVKPKPPDAPSRALGRSAVHGSARRRMTSRCPNPVPSQFWRTAGRGLPRPLAAGIIT